MENDRANSVELVPNLLVRGGKAAVEFYKSAFGAIELFRLEPTDGTIFAELSIQGGDSSSPTNQHLMAI